MLGALRKAAARRTVECTDTGVAVVRVSLYSICVLLLLSQRDAVPAWDSFYWLTVGLGLTSITLLFWARSRGANAALTVSTGLDLLLLFTATFVIAWGTAGGTMPVGFGELVLVLAVPVCVLHFGPLMGLASSSVLGAWHFLTHAQIARPQDSMGIPLIGGMAALGVGALIALMVTAMRHEHALRAEAEFQAGYEG
ncbi:MAG: hypothetical protein FJ318_01385 [SAR202 cluster bacterium]|nr:hypothetical protein [SAR202 cluster bacterium]